MESKHSRSLEATDAMVIETSFDYLIEVEWKCDKGLRLVAFQAEESPSELGERMSSIVTEDELLLYIVCISLRISSAFIYLTH